MSCRKRIKRARTIVEAAAALPDELVMEILSRLPTKSLARFRSVSKQWRSFISYVSSSQGRILAPSLSGFLFYPGDLFRGSYASISPNPDDFPSKLASLPFNSTVRVIHSCNGLVLLTHNQLTASSLYYVWNPTTMEVVALPELPRSGLVICFLAFHPRHYPHYEAVRFMTEHYYVGPLTVQVYSSITGRWADHQPSNHPTLPPHKWDRNSIFHNGALYFLAGTCHLVSFHIQQKRFHTIILPKVRPRAPGRLTATTCIGESNDQLCYAINLVKPCQLHIYMLLDEDDKWLLTHEKGTHFLNHHPLTCDPACEIPPTYYLQPLAFNPESKVIYLSMRRKIISYHPMSGEMKEVCKLSDHKCTFQWSYFFSIIHCQQSICPPGGTFIKPFTLEYVNTSM